MTRFEGKGAFITGGASGMGLGMARQFAKAGMKVMIADVRAKALATAVDELAKEGLDAIPVELDVTDRTEWSQAAELAREMLGNVHVLVNNAGVGLTGLFEEMSPLDWDFSLSVNLDGVVNGLMTFLPIIKRQGQGGHLVATSSTAGIASVGGASAYVAGKFAVTGLMETLATELQGTGIDVSILLPGPVATNISTSTAAVRRQRDNSTPAPRDPITPGGSNSDYFMSADEIGERLLRGMENRDLFIITHPEFADGFKRRFDAIMRAVPDEPENTQRRRVLEGYGTLLNNDVYDRQRDV